MLILLFSATNTPQNHFALKTQHIIQSAQVHTSNGLNAIRNSLATTIDQMSSSLDEVENALERRESLFARKVTRTAEDCGEKFERWNQEQAKKREDKREMTEAEKHGLFAETLVRAKQKIVKQVTTAERAVEGRLGGLERKMEDILDDSLFCFLKKL